MIIMMRIMMIFKIRIMKRILMKEICEKYDSDLS